MIQDIFGGENGKVVIKDVIHSPGFYRSGVNLYFSASLSYSKPGVRTEFKTKVVKGDFGNQNESIHRLIQRPRSEPDHTSSPGKKK